MPFIEWQSDEMIIQYLLIVTQTITLILVGCCQEVEALKELMKTVDGSKYSVHASSILESHDMSEPAAASSAAASSKVQCCTRVSCSSSFFLSTLFDYHNFLHYRCLEFLVKCKK